MSLIKFSIRTMSIPEKVARSRQIVAAMTGNTHFTTPHPALSEVTAAIADLESAANAAQVARQEAKARTLAQNTKEGEFDNLMGRLVAYVESIAAADPQLAVDIGLEIRSPATSSSDTPPAPASLAATDGDFAGQIDLSWDTVAGARSYVVQCSPDPPSDSSWTHACIATRSQVTVENLVSGTRHWFRVAAVGTRGQGAWSNPVMKMAQ